MKKLIRCLLILLSVNQAKSQIVFCPPGAEWHYEFKFFGYFSYNLPIKYTGDSVINNVNYKKIFHYDIFAKCNDGTRLLTILKQSGDTVFFRNAKTQHSWQILYNFAALPGQTWNTSFLQSNGNWATYTITVDSVKNVLINSINHKRLYVKNNYNPLSQYPADTFFITERLGCNRYLFNFSNSGLSFCDSPDYYQSLCYSDNSFGSLKFSDKPCNYENLLSVDKSIQKNQNYRILPNPAGSSIRIISEAEVQALKIRIIDISGRELIAIEIQNQSTVDVSNLNSGVYIVEVRNNKNERYRTKFVKE
ncbi:MAG: T9SS type A sorting domain-containing protein [Bacteroidia bacterium]|nr:T9SS type A sorting domain-containing protein [Bacteroidia bacterium]